MTQQFASDNNAGMCPAALAALVAANAEGHVPGYGEDPWTERAVGLVRDLFEAPRAQVMFVSSGTAANALSLAQLCRPYHAVIAHALSHIATDEAGAPGFFSGGGWLKTADTPGGKLTPARVEALARAGRGVHHIKPRMLSLTQASELGTVYTAAEIAALSAVARAARLTVHMDGARFANAVATLGASPADLSWRAGVDVLTLGGVKNGLAIGEAVVFFDAALAYEMEWRIKQSGHLTSKMRFITAPWCALLTNDVWLDNARHANRMARRLADAIGTGAGLAIVYPVEANAVFVEIPTAIQAMLRARGWRFYTFEGDTICRLMCAWDTTEAAVDTFVDDIAAVTGHAR